VWGEFRHARVFRRAKRGDYVRFRFLDLCIRFGKIISKACPVGNLFSFGVCDGFNSGAKTKLKSVFKLKYKYPVAGFELFIW